MHHLVKSAVVAHMPCFVLWLYSSCQKRACNIQRCLKENMYNMDACAHEIEALKKCCEMEFAQDSIHCSFAQKRPEEDAVSPEKPAGSGAPSVSQHLEKPSKYAGEQRQESSGESE